MANERPEALFQRLQQRAALLAGQGGAAVSALQHAAEIYAQQARLAAELSKAFLTGRIPDDLAALGPARGLHIEAFWLGEGGGYNERAALRPYVAELAFRGVQPERARPAGFCELCGGAPWIASRLVEPGTHGALRLLHCSLCSRSWAVNRIRCVSCGEENPDKLPIFQTEKYPEARIEACETCRVYVKSIDLTTDGRRIPEVDELLSVGLDLWAQEEGWGRLEPGMAGV